MGEGGGVVKLEEEEGRNMACNLQPNTYKHKSATS